MSRITCQPDSPLDALLSCELSCRYPSNIGTLAGGVDGGRERAMGVAYKERRLETRAGLMGNTDMKMMIFAKFTRETSVLMSISPFIFFSHWLLFNIN